MLVDRWLSVGLAVAGLLMVTIGLTSEVGDHTQRSLTFLGLDCALFSVIGLLYPKSNKDLKVQALSAVQFIAIAVATFGAVFLLVVIAFGAPKPLDDVVLMTALPLGLAAALIVPLLAKQLMLKMQTKQ